MKVTNRSDGPTTYALPELNVRRTFATGETKDVPEAELQALFQTDGGRVLIVNYLRVEDKEWVSKHFDAPLEYFWGIEDVKNCLLNDSVELLAETLDYAPEGVTDLIKMVSWQLPLADLNKIDVIQKKLGFNVQAAIAIAKSSTGDPLANSGGRRQRLRERPKEAESIDTGIGSL